jgi:CRP-like cAMP-binding protein
LSTSQLPDPTNNRILSSLPGSELDRLRPHLEPFHLEHAAVLYEIDDPIEYVYFPTSGMVSLLSNTEQGELLEVGIVGWEGVVGLSVFLGVDRSQQRHLVQVQDGALRMSADAFKAACDQSHTLRSILHRYTHATMTHLAQSAVCNRFHAIEQRLSRWMLLTADVTRSEQLPLTQEFLSFMLGVHRPRVTLAARVLHSAGLIDYNRGHITILDRQGLEAASCECYPVVRQAFRRVFE